MINVAVIGAGGRMGSTVVQAVTDAPDMQVVAQLDAADAITPASLHNAQVAVEFTQPSSTEANVHALLEAGLDAVVGTTGWTSEALDRVRSHADQLQRHVLIAPNFALSAVLAMRFAAMAAPFFESAEIIEMHHPAKVDAPSGTAQATAAGIAQARKQAGASPMPDATMSDPFGARGASIDGVQVHAVRLRGLNAHQEVLLGNPGEQLVIRQDSFDRSSFMPGVLLAIRNIKRSNGLTIGLDQIMDVP